MHSALGLMKSLYLNYMRYCPCIPISWNRVQTSACWSVSCPSQIPAPSLTWCFGALSQGHRFIRQSVHFKKTSLPIKNQWRGFFSWSEQIKITYGDRTSCQNPSTTHTHKSARIGLHKEVGRALNTTKPNKNGPYPAIYITKHIRPIQIFVRY